MTREEKETVGGRVLTKGGLVGYNIVSMKREHILSKECWCKPRVEDYRKKKNWVARAWEASKKLEKGTTCDICERKFDYSFYINNEYWRKIVGAKNFKKNIGRICAHCTLEALGKLDWYIVWNEPLNNTMEQIRE